MNLGIKFLFDAGMEELQKLYPPEEAKSIMHLIFNDAFAMSRVILALDPNHNLEPEQANMLGNMIKKLLQGQPVQQVLGFAWFMDMQFRVNKYVLIPRPETEELVQWIIKSEKQNRHLIALDIGTGTGCIAISIAKAFPNASVFGLDKSQEAIETARLNGIMNHVEVDFINMDILKSEYWKKLPRVDLIVSNPPYVPEADKDAMHKNVLDFEPHLALFVKDHDPLLFYNTISDIGLKYLEKGGRLYFEIYENYGPDIIDMLAAKGYTQTELRQDIHGKDRMIRAVRE